MRPTHARVVPSFVWQKRFNAGKKMAKQESYSDDVKREVKILQADEVVEERAKAIRNGRVQREVVFVETETSKGVKSRGGSSQARRAEAETATSTTEADNSSVEEERPLSKSIWQHIVTGSILTSGAVPYYRYLIAIAVMCFVSIFLTFMLLNADREYRRKNEYAKVLYERSVLMDERRYNLSSKRAVTERLREYGIELIDLSNDSRVIE